jgi:hypothetical protein
MYFSIGALYRAARLSVNHVERKAGTWFRLGMVMMA